MTQKVSEMIIDVKPTKSTEVIYIGYPEATIIIAFVVTVAFILGYAGNVLYHLGG